MENKLFHVFYVSRYTGGFADNYTVEDVFIKAKDEHEAFVLFNANFKDSVVLPEMTKVREIKDNMTMYHVQRCRK